MFQDAYVANANCSENTERSDPNDFTENFEEAQVPLYSTCTRHTKLSAIIALYNHKARHNLSDKGFNELLEIIREMLPDDNTLPDSLYTIKKVSDGI